ncbi:dNTP triphosphohydrolase [Chitinibacter sp. SCUT-21]|uniref:dGTP triphosphohydrolase n=1 Tax=Chitinibacter sp. SCUT-21 TaxID=2970891 RepID=UPI0035A6BE13
MSLDAILDLITEDRLRESTGGKRGLVVASESDKARVVNSSAFRRMQQKTQVFPLEFNAAVRSRLTHSIEVSQIGRYLSQMVLKDSIGLGYEKLTAFTNVVETACLLHDIGNPPFGHFGEAAIKDWLKKKYFIKNADGSGGWELNLGGLNDFDGNPQGFRIVTRLQGNDGFGLNLTCTQLLSTIKYPCSFGNKGDFKKIGVFDSEVQIYKELCLRLKWGEGAQFPFMYLMEAADDIAYCLSDLEDGLEKKIISQVDLEELLDIVKVDRFSKIGWFVEFKTKVVNQAVAYVASNYVSLADKIMNGDKVTLIPKESEVGMILEKVKKITIGKVYRFHEVEEIELAGYSVITGILDSFERLLDLSQDDFLSLLKDDGVKKKGLDVEARLFRRLPKSYIEKYAIFSEEANERLHRIHLIIDYVCGMTDDFSLRSYQNLKGIRVGDA